DAAATGIGQEMFFWTDFVGTLLEILPKNGFPAPRPTQDGLPGQFSALGQFQIGDDEALVVTLAPTDARYQGFMVGNLWFESFEYANRQSSLTSAQAELGSDGRYHYVISATDPGVANWLDTEGHQRGLMFLRWQGLGAGFVPAQPGATLVK